MQACDSTPISSNALDISADSYARWRSSFLGAVTERIEQQAVLIAAGTLRNRAVLDVGCGDGAFGVEAWSKGARVTGVDASQGMLKAAYTRAQARGASIDLICGSANRLPFATASFDVVVMSTLLCTVHDPAAAISEAARVLRPGGRLIIGELNTYSLWALTRRLRGWIENPFWRNVRFWGVRELRGLLAHAGLRIQSVRGCIYYPPFGPVARLLWPTDGGLSHLGTFGAAFLVLRVDKV